jgi:pteridine reductase
MRCAVITGGAKRIGAAISNALLDDGWMVYIHCNSSVEEAGKLAEGRDAIVIQADLGTDAGLKHLIDSIDSPNVDLLIHNASIYRKEDFEKVTGDLLRDYSRIHFEVPFLLTQALLPKLQAKKGSVIGMVDTSWDHAWQGLSHYTATKGALRQLIVNLAGELAPEVRVNGIAPGAIIAAEWEQEMFDRIVETVPLRRAGSPIDVANAVKFLADADYITGYILPVDGGWSLT